VRKDDADHAKLVKRLPGTALRMPEYPDLAYFIQVANIDLSEVVAACSRAGVTPRAL
jgi:hypothetical protein